MFYIFSKEESPFDTATGVLLVGRKKREVCGTAPQSSHLHAAKTVNSLVAHNIQQNSCQKEFRRVKKSKWGGGNGD